MYSRNIKNNDCEDNAVWLANKIIDFFGHNKLGVSGGTTKEGGKDTIRPLDKCLITRDKEKGTIGLCNLHRNYRVKEISLDEYLIPYKQAPVLLKNCAREVRYLSGMVVANSLMRTVMFGVPIEKLNKCTISELSKTPLLPVVDDMDPETDPVMRNIPIEDLRVAAERPDWCFRLTKGVFEGKYPYFARGKDGSVKKLSVEDINKYLSKRISSYANGVGWNDFGILAVMDNPFCSGEKLVLAGGNHEPGTWGMNALLALVSEVPELKTVVRGTVESMGWLGNVIRSNQKIFKDFNFLALGSVSDEHYKGVRVRSIYITGVFALTP